MNIVCMVPLNETVDLRHSSKAKIENNFESGCITTVRNDHHHQKDRMEIPMHGFTRLLIVNIIISSCILQAGIVGAASI